MTYDPNWPHGHTSHGVKCRVLADDIRSNKGLTLAVAIGAEIESVRLLSPSDLEPIPAPKKKVKVWVNLYENKTASAHLSRSIADHNAAIHRTFPRISCAEIEIEEGEGL